jgi:hypothetical protein
MYHLYFLTSRRKYKGIFLKNGTSRERRRKKDIQTENTEQDSRVNIKTFLAVLTGSVVEYTQSPTPSHEDSRFLSKPG